MNAEVSSIVETLTAHEFVPWHGDRDTITAPHCSCGALWSDGPESDELDWHRAHLARALLSSHDAADSPIDECSLHVWTRTQQEREDGKPFWCHECGVSEPDANRLPWPARAARQHRNCNCDECDEERSI